MDMSQYLQLFLNESREHLIHLNELIVGLEQSPDDQEKINSLFRSAHSLKGMAASMGYDEIAELAHRMEDLMYKVREGEYRFSEDIATLLLEGADLLSVMLEKLASGQPSGCNTADLIQRLQDYSPVKPDVTPHPPPLPPEPATPPPATTPLPGSPRESSHTVRIRTDILDRLINTTGELFSTKHRLLEASLECPSQKLAEPLGDMTRLLRELHQIVMQVRLNPFASIVERLPRAVRDIATRTGKEATLTIEGRDIEIDRGMLEELADPLLHILRNAVDHGIESPEERLAAGKERSGRIRLSAWREKDQVAISVEDDGQGMNPDSLIAVAVRKGIVSAEEGKTLSPQDAYMLTCLPGFSTARDITDISGRGVGMDAVRNTIQSMGGRLAIESELGHGTRITLRMPLTIAIINVLLLSVHRFTVGIPVTTVLRTLELRRGMVRAGNDRPVFDLDGEETPLISLNRVMGVPLQKAMEILPVIVTEAKGQRVGIAVDRVLGQREVHVKPVGRPLNRLHGLSGGAVLGNGEIIFVIDPASLL
jgi:two-component system chemotaxis sensor kinase CheA